MKTKLLIIFLALLPMIASANDSGKCGENVYYSYNEATHTLTISGKGAMTSWDNSWSDDRPWHSLGNDIHSLVIEDGVTSIGNYAFYGLWKLSSVIIPNSVKNIGSYAFSDCYSLPSMVIHDNVTSIGEEAFSCCSSLTDVTIGKGLTSISKFAFLECTSLTSVTIGINVTSIESHAFSGCSSLSTVKMMFPCHLNYIGMNAFSDCSSLTSFTIPNSVISIDLSAFARCTGLLSITIPDQVTNIGPSAFQGCSGLKYITIGKSVNTIGLNAFAGSKNLTSVTVHLQEPLFINSFTFGNYQFATLYVPKGCKETYENAYYWTNFHEILEIGEGIELGDANGDGNVDSKDIDVTVEYIMGGEMDNFNFNNTDVNKDKKIDATDIVSIINIIKEKKQ